MATGTEMFNALKRAAAELDSSVELQIHPADATALLALKPDHLVALGYAHSRAEEVSYALFHGNYCPLWESMGIRVVLNHDAPRLMPIN